MKPQLDELFARQAARWPLLAQGIEGLARAATRTMRVGWFDVLVRHIPHRVVSTTAAVDRESVLKRPCFLCAANLPPEEEGVQFDRDFTIYCNPFPIVERHVTIVHREHTAQSIAHRVGRMLELAAALPDCFVVYNGPECGASAPDHMHFQAGARALFPIGNDTERLLLGRSFRAVGAAEYGRNVFLFRGRDRSALADRMDRAIELLARATGRRPEPMINIAAYYESGEWTAYLFARSKHRPAVFYSGQLTVSPAAIDFCGILVVPLARDFESITADAIAAIFREVTLPGQQFQEIAGKLEREC